MLGGSIRRPLLARWLLTFCHTFDSLPAIAVRTQSITSQHLPMGREKRWDEAMTPT
jgi:hypothetical protein